MDNKKDINIIVTILVNELSSSGGFIPYLRKLHSTQGHVVKPEGPLFENTISVTDPRIIKSTLSIGDRPNFLFKFLEPMFGQDNFQIFEADRAAKFRELIGPALGHEDKPQDLDLKAFKHAYDIALSGLFDKQFGMLEASREEEFQNSINYLQETLKNLISKRRGRTNVNGGEDVLVKDMLDILVLAIDPETNNPYTDEMEEIDQVLKCHLPTFEDLSKMDYLTQVVKESLRVHPPGAFCARFLKSDMNVEKITTTTKSSLSSSSIEPHNIDNSLLLKSNTTILYPIPLLHENPNFFENPLEFKPSRFATTTKTIKPSTYCPFGFGARICPAERLALLDVKMMICLIFQKFNVELAMNLNDVQKEERLVVMAKNDIMVKLTLRNR
ncbi:8253_t:CDS:2 [Entrophospora sp. SA101]|nr:7814_t:CDS:2 [Entrophospora sp. SA101]CAJ0927022.1 8253_t:CDS:2 [Entrophospora sp. SA101]